MVNAMSVRKLGSYLLILIFLTAYGRCVADQLGMLHSSDTSCCQTVCEDLSDSCGYCPDSGEPHFEEASEPASNSDQQTPTPCQLCFILDSDSMLIENGVKMPAPVFHELTDFLCFARSVDGTTPSLQFVLHQELMPRDYLDPATLRSSRLLRLTTKATPVRGPSAA